MHTLTQAGFRTSVQMTPSSSVPPDHVIGTVPRAGTPLTHGSTVELLVSSGPQTVPVPNVTGELKTTAALTLVNAGLKTGTVTQQDSSQTPGTVLSQSPADGSLAPMNTAVDLVVAQQPVQLVLISVIGKDPATAGNDLGDAGFKVKTSPPRPVSNPAQVGLVVAQSPAPGSSVKRGATVTITVGEATTTTTTSTSSGPTGPTGPVTTTTNTAAGPAAPGAP